MKLLTQKTLKEFKKQVYPFLSKHEAENSFVFDLTQKIENSPKNYEEVNFWTISDESNILLASIFTTGKETKFVISKCEQNKKTIPFLADHYLEYLKDKIQITAGLCSNSEDTTILSEYLKIMGKIKDYSIAMKMLMYTLTKDNLILPNRTNNKGELILATTEHSEICLNFWTQFMIDTFGNNPKFLGSEESYRKRIDHDMKNEYIFLWKLKETDEIVSMCEKTGYTPNGYRIGMIFTPKNHRKNGYGSAVTAALCKKIFDDGGKYCSLFADTINPTSNKIYQNIGFKEKGINEIHHYE
eukprot:gene775-9025_t